MVKMMNIYLIFNVFQFFFASLIMTYVQSDYLFFCLFFFFLRCFRGGVWVLYRTNSTTSCPAATQRSIFRQVFLITLYHSLYVLPCVSARLSLFLFSFICDVIILLLLFIRIYFGFRPYKGKKRSIGLYPKSPLIF